ASDIELSKQKTLKAAVEAFSFAQEKGIDLQRLKFQLALDTQQLALKNVIIQTANSKLSMAADVTYSSLNALINHTEKAQFLSKTQHNSLRLADALLFMPELKTNPYLKTLSQHKTSCNLGLNLRLYDLQITYFTLHWCAKTTLIAQADVFEITAPEQLHFK